MLAAVNRLFWVDWHPIVFLLEAVPLKESHQVALHIMEAAEKLVAANFGLLLQDNTARTLLLGRSQEERGGSVLPLASLRSILEADALCISHEDEVFEFLKELCSPSMAAAARHANEDAKGAAAEQEPGGCLSLWDTCRFAQLSADLAFEAVTLPGMPVPAKAIALSLALEKIEREKGEEACNKRLRELCEEEQGWVKRRRLAPRVPDVVQEWEMTSTVTADCVDASRKTVTFTYTSGDGYAVLNARVPTTGRVVWSFFIEKDTFGNNQICVGVSERPIRGRYNLDTSFIVLRSYTGMVERTGSSPESFIDGENGTLVTGPTEVLVAVDYDKGTVSFTVGTVGPKVLFRNLTKPVYPAVYFYSSRPSLPRVTFQGRR